MSTFSEDSSSTTLTFICPNLLSSGLLARYPAPKSQSRDWVSGFITTERFRVALFAVIYTPVTTGLNRGKQAQSNATAASAVDHRANITPPDPIKCYPTDHQQALYVDIPDFRADGSVKAVARATLTATPLNLVQRSKVRHYSPRILLTPNPIPGYCIRLPSSAKVAAGPIRRARARSR